MSDVKSGVASDVVVVVKSMVKVRFCVCVWGGVPVSGSDKGRGRLPTAECHDPEEEDKVVSVLSKSEDSGSRVLRAGETGVVHVGQHHGANR